MKPGFELLVVFPSWGLDKTAPRFSETELFGRGDKFNPRFPAEHHERPRGGWVFFFFYLGLSHLEFDLEKWDEGHGQMCALLGVAGATQSQPFLLHLLSCISHHWLR